MANIPTPDVAGYIGGNSESCYRQFVEFARAHDAVDMDGTPLRTLAYEIARKVGEHYCVHDGEPSPLDEDMGLVEKRAAAASHPGLCGFHQAGIIAAVRTQDVREHWGTTITANRFRNQVKSSYTSDAYILHSLYQ